MVRMIRHARCAATARRFAADSSGQAVAEFALVVPILLLLLVGLAEFGRAWNTYQVLMMAAREGARVASLANSAVTEDSVRARIRNTLSGASLNPDKATITLVGVSAPSGQPTQVQLRYPFNFAFLTRLSAGAAGGAINLSTSVVFRHE